MTDKAVHDIVIQNGTMWRSQHKGTLVWSGATRVAVERLFVGIWGWVYIDLGADDTAPGLRPWQPQYVPFIDSPYSWILSVLHIRRGATAVRNLR